MKKHIQDLSQLSFNREHGEYFFIIKNIVPYQSEDPIETEIIFSKSCFNAIEFMNRYKSTMAVLALHVVNGNDINVIHEQWYDDEYYLSKFAPVRPPKVEHLLNYLVNNSENDSFMLSEII